ncbi:aspartate aminotransferase family protein [Paenibacillus sp. YYML68]|uniref:pyridoxal phosphate-dependent decarboxylase family protein n=1 Tax=Paenibacillus sp. YYML68 TaxID=2909250 RepID=UPI002490FFFC|nr:aspartate aminotransferase family protein [Paenibacillus sp. YYML68]
MRIGGRGGKRRMTEYAYENDFLTGKEESQRTYRQLMHESVEVLIQHFASADKPYSGADPLSLRDGVRRYPVCPEEEGNAAELLPRLGELLLQHSAVVTHPLCMAHLHCPPLQASLAAELLITGTNASMDSWDQSMSATMVEQEVVRWLCSLFSLPEGGSDGVFTSGGTQSNLMGLLLARDHYAEDRWGWSIQQRGLPPEASRLRVLCSEAAHFTVKQSAALLGLGHESVMTIPCDERGRMRVDALEKALLQLRELELLPFAIVATAGTTDLGAVDPLPELAAIARRDRLWLHTDAAYGGAVLLSDQYASLLDGIEASDSIAVDFHKLFFQPISCGAFLVRERSMYRYVRLHADYLNPQRDDEDGVPNLVGKSLQTTRRFDALKLYMSLQLVGRKRLGCMIDTVIELASVVAEQVRRSPALELLAEPVLSTVVFRYRGELDSDELIGEVNRHIREELLRSGEAVIARTRLQQNDCLKLTLLNPTATSAEIGRVIERIVSVGSALEQQHTKQYHIV